MENSIQPITKPEQAIAQLVSEQYIDWLMDYLERDIKNWPAIQHVVAAQPKPEKIKKFMLQRYLAAEAYIGGRDGDPGFLGFAVANLSEASDPVAESALELLEKKRKEEMEGSGLGVKDGQNDHRDSWMRLLKVLGVSQEEFKRAEVKEPTRNYISELSDTYSTAEWQTTMAAFAAYEKILPFEFAAILEMLKGISQVNSQDLEVLTQHQKGEAKYLVESKHILQNTAVDKENNYLIFQGVEKQLEAHREYFQSLAKYLYE